MGMKEFEKWVNDWVCDIPNLKCSSMECDDCKIILQQGWRAALEWDLEGEGYNPNRDWRDKLIEELEGGDA